MSGSSSPRPCASASPSSPLRRALIGALAAAPLLAGAAHAEDAARFPSRLITIIVPYTPGSIGDQFIRPVAQGMAKALGQPVIVDNRPGASQAIGAADAARAAPDGYTLFMGTQSGLVLNRAARKSLPFNPEKDFAPISNLFSATMYLYARQGLPVKNVAELIALAKSKPGALTFASIGPGTSSHLAGELLKSTAGIDMLHVPYKGGPEANNAVMAGQVDLMFDGGNALHQMMGRGVRVIGVGSQHRATNLPDVPTLAEQGLKGYNVTPWFGLFAPAGTPRTVIDKIRGALLPQLAAAETKQRVAPLGLEVAASTPEELGRLVKDDYAVWSKVMREAGIKPE